MMRDFEQFLNKKYAKQLRKRPLTVYLTATNARTNCFPRVVNGTADIAAGNLTRPSGARRSWTSCCPPLIVRELLVTGSKSPPVASLDELSGKRLHVRKATSYYESVLALNQTSGKSRKKAGGDCAASRRAGRQRTSSRC
jgi:membrane-bound lytic murein transglycosylase MltF